MADDKKDKQGSHKSTYYTGGSNPAADFEKAEGFEKGRIKGQWEDAMKSAVPSHSERNWNHAAQMTGQDGTTDGFLDSQEEVDAAAEWLRNNSPGGGGEEEEEEAYDPPSKAKAHAEAYVAAKDTSDLAGDTTQMKFGYNPVTGEEGYETSDGQGIASRFMNTYKDNLTEQMTGKKPGTVSGDIATEATQGGGQMEVQGGGKEYWEDRGAVWNPPKFIGEQTANTMGMP